MFTISALTTTGVGDIPAGHHRPADLGGDHDLGVTLFFNLARALIAPHKVRFPCPTCGLQRHDVDAVH